MNDTIYRKEAIDALDGEITVTGRANAEAVRGYARLVADRLKRLPSAQQWIPVTERKPDDGYRVIVTDFGYVEVSRWFDGRWYDIDGNTLKGVTAWMPLPEPWRGEEDG